ncbi:MAG: AAA family ATPase [Fimbriimonadaceae bacterium]|nr:AAA family ATPase [Fimbriimonadaceae bacterium]
MKLLSASIERFRGVKEAHLALADPDGAPYQRYFVIGDNGTGKTTVLQAIAWVLGQATRQFRPEQFRWFGFLPERISSQGPTAIELEVAFEQDELAAISEVFELWQRHNPDRPVLAPPAGQSRIRLRYSAATGVTADGGAAALHQFLGRFNIRQLLRQGQYGARDYLVRVGDVFWLDQMRNLGVGSSIAAAGGAGDQRGEADDTAADPWQAGVEQLRDSLVRWWSYHRSDRRSPQSPDYVAEIEQRFSAVFRGARFLGTEPAPPERPPYSPRDYFYIEQNGRHYDLAEMSAGEQTVFAFVYQAVVKRMARSIVLIDELDLNLHPPAAQWLYQLLPELAQDCQFVLSTHSRELVDLAPAGAVHRLPGGVPCV